MNHGIGRFVLAVMFSVAGVSLVHADCAKLHALAQQHAYDMARHNSLDHAGFMRHRGPAGAPAENVAVGCDTEACARRMWMQSPQHRANMMLGGCEAVASAVSAAAVATGRWKSVAVAMEFLVAISQLKVATRRNA
jgi:hypothetical protein